MENALRLEGAVEISLDNNMLAPLGTLHIVKSFKLSVNKTFKIQLHHVKMLQDLKDKIERNWQLIQVVKDS